MPAGVILLAVVAVGVSGYMLIERWNFLDAIYMVITTVLTVGFQEVHPLSSTGRIITMVVAVAGVGTAFYAATQVMEIIVEGEILGYRGRKKMDRRISEMRDHYIICGFGRVGHQVGVEFSAAGIPFVVIDSKPETAVELEPKGVPHLVADATSDDILEEAGIRRAKGLVACSDSDVANVYVTLSARTLNSGLYIVARSSQRETEKKLKAAGANRVISPYFISGRRMAALVAKPVTSDFLDLVTHGGEVEFRLHEVAIPPGSRMVSKSLADAEIRDKTGVVVLAIQKSDGSFNLQPRAASVIDQGDTLVVIGTQEQIESLTQLAG